MPLLECRKLTRRPWIDGFDLTIHPGEIVLLTGPSGSGKTLLLRTIADLDPADSGRLQLEERERNSMSPCEWRRQVLYLHQVPVRLPGRVRDNLERIAALRVHAARDVSAPPGTGSLGDLDNLDADAPIERLSGGEAQRLALYRALALDPAVLLLDEATSALDEKAAREAERAVLEWVARGRAALWVSHDPAVHARSGAREVPIR